MKGYNHYARVQKLSVKSQLAEKYGLQCFYCETPFKELRHATIDHIFPRARLAKKGKFSGFRIGNSVLACKTCNCAKGDRIISLEKFKMERLGRYKTIPKLEGLTEEALKLAKPLKDVFAPNLRDIKYPENPLVQSAPVEKPKPEPETLWEMLVRVFKGK